MALDATVREPTSAPKPVSANIQPAPERSYPKSLESDKVHKHLLIRLPEDKQKNSHTHQVQHSAVGIEVVKHLHEIRRSPAHVAEMHIGDVPTSRAAPARTASMRSVTSRTMPSTATRVPLAS